MIYCASSNRSSAMLPASLVRIAMDTIERKIWKSWFYWISCMEIVENWSYC